MVTTRAKFKKNQNSLKTMVGSNDGLLIEILRRLPAKSIIRFKSVSKHWQTLLSQRYFTLLFDNLSISPGFFCHNSYIPFDVENQSTRPFQSLNFYPDRLGIRIVQSCNGLLLCCSNEGPESTRKYYVFNPTTKQFAVIPPLVIGKDFCTYIRFFGLAFHQTDCVHFKVVCVYPANSIPNPHRKLYHIQIYSSDTGKWRILSESFPMFLSLPFSRYGVYWNGAIHWVLLRNLFYFILDSEHLQSLPLPDYDENVATSPYLASFYITESRGHLHLAETASNNGLLHLNVYEMLSDRSRWVLKYQVEHHELLAASGSVLNYKFYEFKILDVVKGEKEDDTFMLVRIPDKIMKYTILDKSFKLIFDLREIIPNFGVKAYRYIESIGSF